MGSENDCQPRQGEDGEKCHDPSIRIHRQRSTAHPVAVQLGRTRWAGVADDSIAIGPGISVGIAGRVAIALGEKQKLRYQYGLLEKQFRRRDSRR